MDVRRACFCQEWRVLGTDDVEPRGRFEYRTEIKLSEPTYLSSGSWACGAGGGAGARKTNQPPRRHLEFTVQD